MNYKISVFEDNKLAPLNYYSGKEIEALENIISNYHSGEKDLPYLINDEETSYGVLYNVDEERMKKYENKKILVNPPQYGSNPWGKVEILFENDDSIHNIDKFKSKNLNENKEVVKEKVEKSKSKKTDIESNKEAKNPKSKKTESEANQEIVKEKVVKPKSKKTESEANEEIVKEKIEKLIINDKDNTTLISTNTDSSQKKIRKCSNCKEFGHDIRKCSLINK